MTDLHKLSRAQLMHSAWPDDFTRPGAPAAPAAAAPTMSPAAKAAAAMAAEFRRDNAAARQVSLQQRLDAAWPDTLAPAGSQGQDDGDDLTDEQQVAAALATIDDQLAQLQARREQLQQRKAS